jgi:hypothetical protein
VVSPNEKGKRQRNVGENERKCFSRMVNKNTSFEKREYNRALKGGDIHNGKKDQLTMIHSFYFEKYPLRKKEKKPKCFLYT